MVRIEQDGDDVLMWVKAVPGASRDEIAGAIGDRLKVRVSAPAHEGRANEAICALLARSLGFKPRSLALESGHGGAEKVIRVHGTTVGQVEASLDAARTW
jgi:uncharacterized protein (TIGR00251 family)